MISDAQIKECVSFYLNKLPAHIPLSNKQAFQQSLTKRLQKERRDIVSLSCQVEPRPILIDALEEAGIPPREMWGFVADVVFKDDDELDIFDNNAWETVKV